MRKNLSKANKEQPKIEIIISPRNRIHNFDWPLDIFELFSHRKNEND